MIPNIFHLIYFYKENVEFPLTHSITVNSVRMLNNPDKIYFYSDRAPEGKYWEKISPYVKLVKVKAPKYVFDRKLYHLAHKSDVLRLQILLEQGGIYIDMDVICKKPFTDLLKHDMVLGKQGRWRKMGLCNGVILANKDSEFLKLWYDEFRNFRSKGNDKYWSEMSVSKPKELAKKHPDLIHKEPYNSFHYPLYYPYSLRRIFVHCNDYKDAYCHHLWEAASYKKYLSKLTEKEILKKDTTYNIIARKYL
ncbi:MAG: glycosyltransferase [Ignavibacteria bacterium]